MNKQTSNNKNSVKVRILPFIHDVKNAKTCDVALETIGEENNTWHFFGFCQTFSNKRGSLSILSKIITNTFQAIREKMRSNDTIDIEFIFDEILREQNTELMSTIKKTNHSIASSSIIVLGIIKNGKICIADHGKAFGKIVIENKNSQKIIPIITSTINNNKINETLFESVVCGNLTSFSRAVLSTPDIEQIGRNDVFLNLLSKRTTTLSDIWIKFQKKLLQANNPECAGILIESYTNEQSAEIISKPRILSEYIKNPPKKYTAVSYSICSKIKPCSRLVKNFYSIFIAFSKKILTYIIQKCPTWIKLPKPMSKICFSTNNAFKRVSTNQTSQTVANKIKKITFSVGRTILLTMLWFATNLFLPIHSFLKKLFNIIKKISTKQQIALIIALLAVLAFGTSIYIKNSLNTKNKREVSINRITKQFYEKKQIAESKMIFNEIDGAREAITLAQNLLLELPREEKDDILYIQSLEHQIKNLVNELRKEKNIELSNIVFNGNSNLNVNRKIAYAGNRLFTWTNTELFDITKNRKYPLNKHSDKTLFSYDENGIMFLNNEVLTMLNFENNTMSYGELLMSVGQKDIKAIYYYGSKMYSFDSSGIIWRHSPSSTGFARGVKWLDKAENIKNPISAVIDSNIYVLDNGSKIYKFFRGKTELFNHSSIDPPIESAINIWTSAESNYLYILEPVKQRLITLDKNGKILEQYHFDKKNINHFAINEKDSIGYIVDNDIVYSFPLISSKN